MISDYLDDPDLQVIVLALLAAVIIALAIFGLVDMDDSKTNQIDTIPNTVYTHPEEVKP